MQRIPFEPARVGVEQVAKAGVGKGIAVGGQRPPGRAVCKRGGGRRGGGSGRARAGHGASRIRDGKGSNPS